MTSIEDIIRSHGAEITDRIDPPSPDELSVKRFREICATNKCGNYGKSWTCPPAVGPADDCLQQIRKYRNVRVITKRYDINVNNETDIQRKAREYQDICRIVKHIFFDSGQDVLVLADGPCVFCDRCSYPEKCEHPEETIPSVSGYGIDMCEYLKNAGMDLVFNDREMTLYGLIFFN